MLLQHSFLVPLPVDETWKLLLDIDRIVPAVPGAGIDHIDGDNFAGNMRVKLGAVTMAYRGQGSFVERDEERRRAVMQAAGKDTKGGGTVKAAITFEVAAAEEQSKVDVTTDLAITGKPAQFGRGLINDVGAKIIAQFADNLAQQLPAQSVSTKHGAAESLSTHPVEPVLQSEPLDLIAVAGNAVAKRALIGAAVFAALFALVHFAQRARS